MASTDIQFKVTGVESLRKRLKANNLLMTPLRNYLNGTGKIIKEKSKLHAPVDTGALQRSIKYTRVKKSGRIPNKVLVYASAKHSSFVHGDPNKKFRMTKPFNRTRPHFPPVKALTGWAKRHGMNPYVVANSIAQKGTPIVRFLKMGFRDSAPERKVLLSVATKQIERQFKKGRKGKI